jgi:predicted ABC-type ATPase
MPRYILIAGVNGCGKSTLTEMIPEFESIPKINLDTKIRELGDWKDKQNFLIAGKEVVREIQYFLEERITFIQETTLCGSSIKKHIKRAKSLGYDVEIHFIGLDSFEIAQERVHHRVRHGGHGIPDEDIQRRYFEGMRTLHEVFALCAQITFYDNSDAMRRFCKIVRGKITWQSLFTPDWYHLYFSDIKD